VCVLTPFTPPPPTISTAAATCCPFCFFALLLFFSLSSQLTAAVKLSAVWIIAASAPIFVYQRIHFGQ
jgi:hypothetical protein